MKHVALNQPIH